MATSSEPVTFFMYGCAIAGKKTIATPTTKEPTAISVMPVMPAVARITATIIDMIFTANPDASKIGLLYSLSEANSALPIEQAKALIEEKGASYVEYTASTNDEVVAAASSLIAEGVDAIFTPTDNVIMAAELAIYEDLAAAGIPHYTGADSFVRNGGFTTCGVNYTDLGTKTADLAYQAVTQGMDGMEDYYTMEGGIVTVNTETASTLGIDYSGFTAFGEIVEVTTSED